MSFLVQTYKNKRKTRENGKERSLKRARKVDCVSFQINCPFGPNLIKCALFAFGRSSLTNKLLKPASVLSTNEMHIPVTPLLFYHQRNDQNRPKGPMVLIVIAIPSHELLRFGHNFFALSLKYFRISQSLLSFGISKLPKSMSFSGLI